MRLTSKFIRIIILSILLSQFSLADSQETTKLNSVSDNGILVLQSADSSFVWRLDARLYLDAAFYQENKNDLSNGTELRRGRLAVKSILWRDWRVEFDINFADNEVNIEDAWASYSGLIKAHDFIKAGQFKEPFSLEELTSSKYITFMERALPNLFAPKRNMGIAYSIWGNKWQFTSGIFGEDLDEVDANEDEAFGISGRLSAAPIKDDKKLLHVGISAFYRTPEADNPDEIRFRSYPETDINRDYFLDTGIINNVRNYNCYGFELASVYKKFSFQGEYIASSVNRENDNPNLSFSGAYAFASYFIFGGNRTYVAESGEFENEVSNQKPGALELAIRYSTADLTDKDVAGGSSTQYTAGLNWYFNPNARLMVNYSMVNNDNNANADGEVVRNDDLDILQFRFQVTF